jgi:Putative zinc-finger
MATVPPEQPAPPPSRLTCQRVTDLIVDYVTAELEAPLMLAMQQHLGRCVDCQVFLQTYQDTIRHTRQLQYEALPTAMQDTMLNFLRTRIQQDQAQS